MKARLVFATALVLFVGVLAGRLGSRVNARVDFPDPVGYVNDFAEVLDNDEELDARLQELENTDSTQIVVITTNELPEDLTLEEFVPRLSDENPEWAVGQEGPINGVVFTVVVDTREMRIDVGYGLEGTLTDLESRLILDDEVRPRFREDDYEGGVEAGVDAIIQAVEGEYEGSGEAAMQAEMEEFFGSWFFIMLMVIFGLLPYTAAFLARSRSWWLGGVLGFIGGIVLSVALLKAEFLGVFRYASFVVLPIVLTPIGLLFDFILSKNYQIRKQRGLPTGFFTSIGGFSSGRSGSSFGSSSGGGFSSGGGSFGGGGSSSSW